jgi:hypothetical protein
MSTHTSSISIRVLLALTVLLASMAAQAQCMARHGVTKQLVKVIEVNEETYIFRAFSTRRPDGYPVIYYGHGYRQLSPLLKRFVAMHECAHLVEFTSDEFLANCSALQAMRLQGLSKEDEEKIARFHIEDGPLPMQYGGSGAAFWARTIACAGPRNP